MSNPLSLTLPLQVLPLSPGGLKKSNSCNNITFRKSSTSHSNTPAAVPDTYNLIRQSLLQEIKEYLPALIHEELKPALKKRDELSKEINSLKQKVDGYKKQVDVWVKLAKTLDDVTIPKLVDDMVNLEKSWKSKEKHIADKTKDFIATKNKMQNDMTEISRLQGEWEKLLNAKTDGCQLMNLEKSQEFVSAEYEEFREQQKELVTTVTQLQQKVAKQEIKTEHNANYPRWNALELRGVPVVPVDAYGNENCKEMVLNICKELQYWVPPSAISTAHRLKKHPSSRGPPAMIVKFNNRDIRNDVFELRRQIKDKYI